MIGQFFDGSLADFERRQSAGTKIDAVPAGRPLTSATIKVGMNVVVYNHDLKQIILRGRVESPIWFESALDDALTYRGGGKILVYDEGSGQLKPHFAADMGLITYESGITNPVNRTYLA